MQEKQVLRKLTLWLMLLVVSTQWSEVLSATFSNTKLSARFELNDEDNNDANEITESPKNSSDNHISKDKLLYSDEFFSSEYDDDDDFQLDLSSNKQSAEADHEWDLLIFTQQWPVTTCYHWREEDKTHPCTLPTKKEFWTIHGIWPTKLGHMGPSFCNKSADFNLDQLKGIADSLKNFWPDIDGQIQTDWLWKHEWLKHGTCAATLEELDDELKYFGQGLNWRENYLMSNILGSSGIHPDSNNTVAAIQTAIVKVLGKNPSIHCIYDNKRDLSFLAEIRICFNKTLDLVDCDGVKRGDTVTIDYPGGTIITNCHISKPVHYPSIVPSVHHHKRTHSWRFPVVNLYKLIQFIMWFTL